MNLALYCVLVRASDIDDGELQCSAARERERERERESVCVK